jgi:hypothetical protein
MAYELQGCKIESANRNVIVPMISQIKNLKSPQQNFQLPIADWKWAIVYGQSSLTR